MEVKVNIEDYFDRDELRSIVEDEVRNYVYTSVQKYFNHRSYRDFVEGVALRAYWEAVDKMGEDTMWKVRQQVRKLIPELSIFSLIGTCHRHGEEVQTRLQEVIDDEAEKARPEIAERIRAAYGHAIDSDGASIIADAVYEMLTKALAERGGR